MRRVARILILLTFVGILSGCAWWKDFWNRGEISRGGPEELYRQGFDAYQDGRYKRAVEIFQRIREEHPLSQVALMAELGIADAHFSDGEFGEAELAYTDFLNLHPTNENIPYVLYQLGMCHYKQIMGVDLDQTETVKAKKEFERLIARYPASQFAAMAEKMLTECRKRLCEQEFYVARFYYRQDKHQAALKRFETIAREYANLGFDDAVNEYIRKIKERIAAEERKGQKKTGGS